MDEKKYHKALGKFCENDEIAQWFDELGRGTLIAAFQEISADAFKMLAKELPAVLQAAADHGKPPFGDIPGSRKIYSIIDPAPGFKDEQPHANFRESVDHCVNSLFDDYSAFKGCNASDISSTDESRFARMKLACERLQVLLKAFGKHPFGSLEAFGDEVDDKSHLKDMTAFFANESLQAALPKPDTSAQDALREQLKLVGKAAVQYRRKHEATFDEFENALNEADRHTTSAEAVKAFFNPLLEKFHLFSQGGMQEIRELLGEAREKHGSIEDLANRFNQEPKEAFYYLEQKETEFDSFCNDIAARLEHQVELNLEIASYQSDDDVERRVEIYQENELLTRIGLSFSPGNESLLGHAATIEERIAGDIEAHRKAVEKAEWPGHAESWAGATDIDDLAKIALKDAQRIMKKESQEFGNHYFAAAVAGNWYVSRRNILREPVEIRLPVWVAHTLPNQPGIARVAKAYMVSSQVKEEPPFSSFTSSEEFRMPIDKIVKSASVIDQKALKAGTK